MSLCPANQNLQGSCVQPVLASGTLVLYCVKCAFEASFSIQNQNCIEKTDLRKHFTQYWLPKSP